MNDPRERLSCDPPPIPDDAWTRPQPATPVPDNIRQLAKAKTVHP